MCVCVCVYVCMCVSVSHLVPRHRISVLAIFPPPPPYRGGAKESGLDDRGDGGSEVGVGTEEVEEEAEERAGCL